MKYKSLESVFRAFRKLRVLVIGDVMVDSYVWGKVERISPEAPVQVVHVKGREARLGGAGNVAFNCLALGTSPTLVSVTGKDITGKQLLGILKEYNMDTSGIIQSRKRKTTAKERIIAGSQQLLRVDDETEDPLDNRDNNVFLDRIRSILPSFHLVIFEDYDKGLLGKNNIGEIIDMSAGLGIPTIVDPKRKNFFEYRKASLFKPNLKEMKEGLGSQMNNADIKILKEETRKLAKKLSLGSVMVTLSENGIFYLQERSSVHVKAHKREIADVSGAGDTVVSISGLCFALGLTPKFTAELANLGGGLVCEHPGVVPVNREKLIREAGMNGLASCL